MSDVSVLGCGSMGRALIEALAEAGNRVTIWNRTEDKAKALAGPHVRAMSDPTEAIAASSIAIMAVAEHAVARTLLEDAGAQLADRTALSISFATPEQASSARESAEAVGGRFLELAVMAYPSDIGTDAAHLLVSGDHGAFEHCREQLNAFGRVAHVGDAPGAAFATEMAVMLSYLPMAVGMLQGAKVAELHGLPLEHFAETVLRVQPPAIESLLERITSQQDPGAPAPTEASVNVWADGIAEYRGYLDELGLATDLYDALQRVFSAAIEAGHGESDWTTVARVTSSEQGAPDRGPRA